MRPLAPKIQRFPELPYVSMIVTLILQLLATKTSVKRKRHKAVHVWYSTRLSLPPVTLPILYVLEVRCPLSSLETWLCPSSTRSHSCFLECVTARNPKGFPPTKPFRHQYHASQCSKGDKRQRVKCHMRAHTVAEPSDTQQKNSMNKFSTLTCGLCDERWFETGLVSAVEMSMYASRRHHV